MMRINTDVESSHSAQDLSKAETLQKYGLFFQKMGELDLAVSVYQRVLDLGADSPDLRFNYGAARLKQIRPTEALNHFKAAARREPEEPGIHLGMANSHQLLGDIASAEACLEKELMVSPDSAQAAVNLGWILEEQNRVPEALMQYRKALYYNPNHPDLRWNHGLACLMLGDYARGWRDYEFRWKARNKQKPTLNSAEWKGDSLDNRSLLLFTEQGFGDTIMFLRFAQQMGRANNRISLQCQPQLKRLLSAQPGFEHVAANGEKLPSHDLHAPLMSLPLLLNLTRENNLHSQAYLSPGELSIVPIPEAEPGHKKVTVTWTSAPHSEIREKKTVPYSKFSKLFDTPNCTFYSVQINADATAVADMNRRSNVHDLRDAISDFSDTANIISQTDLIISVDTATAHLAGALGKPVWTLLPYAADWRWRLHRTDTPWYPSMRLFRQTKPGHWDDLMEEINHCLFNHCAQFSTSRLAGGVVTSS
jgi:tetratricopeptide (TPR) repeat protein